MTRTWGSTPIVEIEESPEEAPRLQLLSDPRLARRVHAIRIEQTEPMRPPRPARRTNLNTRALGASRSVDFSYD